MSASTTLNRAAVVDRLVELVTATAPADTTVLDGPPRDPQAGKLVAVGDVTGDLSPAAMTQGRKRVDDRFTVELLCICWDPGAGTLSEVRGDAEQLADAVVQVVVDRPRLEATPGGSGLTGVVSATVGRIDGPNPWWDGDGTGAAVKVTVEVHTRIH